MDSLDPSPQGPQLEKNFPPAVRTKMEMRFLMQGVRSLCKTNASLIPWSQSESFFKLKTFFNQKRQKKSFKKHNLAKVEKHKRTQKSSDLPFPLPPDALGGLLSQIKAWEWERGKNQKIFNTPPTQSPQNNCFTQLRPEAGKLCSQFFFS